MKIVIFTSNAVRHRYVANSLAEKASEALVVSECRPCDKVTNQEEVGSSLRVKNFAERHESELEFFPGQDSFRFPVLPILWGEVNFPDVYKLVNEFDPDMVFVFGSSIIKEPMLSLLPTNRTINLHLGLSPYYRGSGTNFWPFVNAEPEYTGATLLHLDPGIDKGDIIAHVKPTIEEGDTTHSIGNKTIQAGVEGLIRCLKIVEGGKDLPRTPQWDVPNPRYYKKNDLTDEVMLKCQEQIDNGLIENYLTSKRECPVLIPLP